MAEKKYKGRKAYLNDFHKNEKGDYEYQGALYEWKGEKETLRKELGILRIICIATLAVLVVAGCVDAPGVSNSFYVIIPYTVSFVFGISTAWGMWRLTFGGNPLRAYVYEASVVQIPIRTVGTMIGAGAAVLGEVIFLFRNGFAGKAGASILFLFLEATALVLSVILRKKVKKMAWEKKS